MPGISQFMSDDHHRCDDFFVNAEKLVSSRDWPQAKAACDAFLTSMEHHFSMEEEVLFPAFEVSTGHGGGPTFVMRHEHAQMRQLFKDMADALAAKSDGDFLGASETLLVLMQQHNMKEEQILYPMCDRLLDSEAVLAKMRNLA